MQTHIYSHIFVKDKQNWRFAKVVKANLFNNSYHNKRNFCSLVLNSTVLKVGDIAKALMY